LAAGFIMHGTMSRGVPSSGGWMSLEMTCGRCQEDERRRALDASCKLVKVADRWKMDLEGTLPSILRPRVFKA